MEVLLLGPEGTETDAAHLALLREGHGVHHCAWSSHLPADRRRDPCVGASEDAACPLHQPLDVALLVGEPVGADGMAPMGLGCAIRGNLPVAQLDDPHEVDARMADVLRERDRVWSAKLREITGRDDLDCVSTRMGDSLHVAIHADVGPDEVELMSRLATRGHDIIRNSVPAGIRTVDFSVAPNG